MSEMNIQKASLSPEVLEELLAMSARWEQEANCCGYRTNTAEDLKGQDIFIATVDGKTVGYLFCHIYTQEKESCTVPHGSRCLEIEELYVLPEYRSRGLGKALYEAAVDGCGGNADYVTLTTASKNYKAILHFYIDKLDMTFWSARLFQKRRKTND